jgi:hypothetical protein
MLRFAYLVFGVLRVEREMRSFVVDNERLLCLVIGFFLGVISGCVFLLFFRG